MAEIVKRGDYPVTEWDPVRMMREMMRWEPFRMMGLGARLDRDLWLPQFEVRENGGSLRVMADLPGIRREDVEVTVSGNELVVSGQRQSEDRHEGERVHTYEREFGQFTRTFMLPDHADLDHVTSELRDGVLTIVVPLKAGAKPRKIQVGGANPKS